MAYPDNTGENFTFTLDRRDPDKPCKPSGIKLIAIVKGVLLSVRSVPGPVGLPGAGRRPLRYTK